MDRCNLEMRQIKLEIMKSQLISISYNWMAQEFDATVIFVLQICRTLQLKNHLKISNLFWPFTLTYTRVGLTQRDRLLGNVHGVVVQPIIATSGSSSNGKLTITAIEIIRQNEWWNFKMNNKSWVENQVVSQTST